MHINFEMLAPSVLGLVIFGGVLTAVFVLLGDRMFLLVGFVLVLGLLLFSTLAALMNKNPRNQNEESHQ